MDVTEAPERAFEEWCIVELFGRQRRGGRLAEQQLAGAGFFRLEIPKGAGWVTQFLHPSSIYAITPVPEAVARGFAARSQPRPVHRWELPEAPVTVDEDEDSDEDSEDGLIKGVPF